MHRENFTAYETMPEDLAIYMSQNGPHFNKYAFEFAVSNMYKKSASGEEEKITPYTKAKIDELLAKKKQISDELKTQIKQLNLDIIFKITMLIGIK